MKDKIIVKGISCYTKIGVADSERAIGQNLIIDIQVYLDLTGADTLDELKSTLSYVEISQAVQQTCQKREFKILENLAANICQDIFTKFAQVHSTEVQIHKPHIPSPLFNGQASICIFRERE